MPVDRPARATQIAITQPPALEVRLKIGLVPKANHLQWLIEVMSPTDGQVLDMRSKHHAHLDQLDDELEAALASVNEIVTEYVSDPFPY